MSPRSAIANGGKSEHFRARALGAAFVLVPMLALLTLGLSEYVRDVRGLVVGPSGAVQVHANVCEFLVEQLDGSEAAQLRVSSKGYGFAANAFESGKIVVQWIDPFGHFRRAFHAVGIGSVAKGSVANEGSVRGWVKVDADITSGLLRVGLISRSEWQRYERVRQYARHFSAIAWFLAHGARPPDVHWCNRGAS